MTHCRTGCGAEINYKKVHFSSPVDWLDIPMEDGGVLGDVIHDCPKLKPSTNDGANDVLKELQGMHEILDDCFLNEMTYNYGHDISAFIVLPQKLKMHSKEYLSDGKNAEEGRGDPQLVPEAYEKLPEATKKEWKEAYGFELPNKTPEERQAEFWQNIDQAFDFLQRCTDRFPAPFYTRAYGIWHEVHSQLTLFRIFLESTEQYADAINCHIIQGAVDIAKSETNLAAFAEVTGRLHKKLKEQQLAKEWTMEDILAEKNRLIRQGMDEEKAESEAEEVLEQQRLAEEFEQAYPTSIMNWALEQFTKESDNPDRVYGEAVEAGELDAYQRGADQIEVGDTVVKEQSVEELLKPHSQEVFGPLHGCIRKYILYLYDDDEKKLWDEFPDILTQIQGTRDEMTKKTLGGTRNRQKSSTYPMVDESDLGHATFGQLDVILSHLEIKVWKDKDGKPKAQIYTKAGKKAKNKAVIEHDEYALLLKVVKLAARNPLDHENTRKELPQDRKMLLVAAASILMTMMDKMKYR